MVMLATLAVISLQLLTPMIGAAYSLEMVFMYVGQTNGTYFLMGTYGDWYHSKS